MSKILITANPIFPINVGGKNMGGMEVYVNNLAIAFADMGYDVDVIGSKESTSAHQRVNMLNLTQLSINERRKTEGNQIGINWTDYKNLLMSLDIDSYELICVNSTSTAMLQYLNDHVTSKKIVYYVQVLPRWAVCKKDVIAINKMQNVHQKVISTLEETSWNDIGGHFSYLPYGFNDTSTVVRDDINYHYLAMCARLIREKGAHKLIDILKNQPDWETEGKGFTGHIVGFGVGDKYWTGLEAKMAKAKNIRYRDDLSGDNSKWIKFLCEEKPCVVSMASIEALGITPIEAFMCGCPCFCIQTKASAISETISRACTPENRIEVDDQFYITPVGGVAVDEKAFIRMIEWCVKIRPFNSKLIREYFKDTYSMSTHISNLLNLIGK